MPLTRWQLIIEDWGWPLVILVSGVTVALLVEELVRRRTRAWAASAHWRGAAVVAHASEHVLFLWLSLLALVVAAENAPKLTAEHLDHIHTLTKIVLIITSTIVVARLVSDWLKLHLANLPGLGASSILTNLGKILIWIVGLMVIFKNLGIDITPVLGALGVGGLAVALALQDTLSNLFAGLQVIATRHIRVGDYIRLSGSDDGFVMDIGWRNTTLRSLANNLVVVPNSKLASTVVINYSLPEPWLWLTLTIGVGYGSDLKRVEAVAREELSALMPPEARAAGMQPQIFFHTFADSAISCDVSLPISRFQDQFERKHQMVLSLHARFRREGIDMPYPTRTVHLAEPLRAPAPAARTT